jgi:hypothetical protein
LEKNPEKIDWFWLSGNRNAIHLLEKNLERIDWRNLAKNQGNIGGFKFSSNPSIFKKVVNYEYLYQRMNIVREEMMMRCMHPSRLERFIEMGGDIDDF